jgi:hypothetical protein
VNHYTAPTAQAPTEPWMVETRVPVGESRLTTHVFVPFLQAAITMLLIAGCVLVFAWRPVAGVVGGIGLLVWGWRILKADGLLTRLETITGRDINGDGSIGKPEHPFVLTNPEEARSRADGLAAQVWRESRAAELVRFAAACATEGTSERKQGITSETQRKKYLEKRQALFELGLAAWDNPAVPNSAWVLRLPPEETAKLIESYVK